MISMVWGSVRTLLGEVVAIVMRMQRCWWRLEIVIWLHFSFARFREANGIVGDIQSCRLFGLG